MAIVTLPNGSQWDTNDDWANQTSGSQDFWMDLQETTTPVETTEATRNLTRDRVINKVYTDTSYTGSNYIVTHTKDYMSGPGAINCFAIRGSVINYTIESK